MKQLILALLISLPVLVQAQQTEPGTDSLNFYYQKLNDMRMAAYDSVRRSPEYLAALDNIDRLEHRSEDYQAMLMGVELLHGDYTDFNKAIADSGFPALKPVSLRLSFGAAYKHKHHIYEVYFGIFGFSSKSKSGDKEIKTNLNNILQFNYGYDLLKSKKASIYPFAGLSLRLSNLSYKRSATTNPAYTSIVNIISNDPSAESTAGSLGYNLGLGIDFLVSEESGVMFSIKGGTSRSVLTEKYDIEGIRYKPGFKQGDWFVGVGFKFTGPGSSRYAYERR